MFKRTRKDWIVLPDNQYLPYSEHRTREEALKAAEDLTRDNCTENYFRVCKTVYIVKNAGVVDIKEV